MKFTKCDDLHQQYRSNRVEILFETKFINFKCLHMRFGRWPRSKRLCGRTILSRQAPYYRSQMTYNTCSSAI